MISSGNSFRNTKKSVNLYRIKSHFDNLFRSKSTRV